MPARLTTFHGLVDGREHVAIGLGSRAHGDARPVGVPLVRLHSECLTGDVLGSARCDCGPQLEEAIRRVSHAGGYLLYLRQEGRDIGLYNKIDAYALQDRGLDTYEANRALGFADDARDYTVAVQMLEALGVDRLDLLSQQPRQGRPARGGRTPGRAPGAHRPPPEPGQPRLPRHQGRRRPRAAPAGALNCSHGATTHRDVEHGGQHDRERGHQRGRSSPAAMLRPPGRRAWRPRRRPGRGWVEGRLLTSSLWAGSRPRAPHGYRRSGGGFRQARSHGLSPGGGRTPATRTTGVPPAPGRRLSTWTSS